ncbi:Leucine-rich repeat (LRR) protein [Catenulispora sp. EB89]|uniref:NACHT domain-containing protein n=1 Tax=Catenulispora sp. EB89 TaxID=3156257 RepID=UPI003513E137
MVFTGAEIAVLKNGLHKAASALGKAALTGPAPGAGSVDKPLRTSRIPGRERRKQTIGAEDAERFARKILERVSGQQFTRPGKSAPRRLEIPAADIDSLVTAVGILMSTLSHARVDMAAVLEAHGEPEVLADRMRAALPSATPAVGDVWRPVLDELVGVVCEHIVEFFTTRETFGAAAGLELLKQSARRHRPEEEAELLAGYARLVREKSHKIRLIGLDLHEDDQAYDLMTGFVDLTIQATDPVEATEGPDRTGDPDQASEHVSWNRMDTLATERRRVLLEGPAGSGKSTLAQWLTLTWLKTPDHAPLPFLIRLREFAGGQRLELPRPLDFVARLAPAYAGRLPGWEMDLLATGRAAVLLDGIDEIPEQLRAEALQWLADLVTAYPHACFVVTTRPAGLNEPGRRRLVTTLGFTRATINPMSALQVSTFIDRWHEAAVGRPHTDTEELREYADSLKHTVRWRRDLAHITTTPLLCAMVCALYHADNRALPRNRTALYERACAMLLEKRDTQQRIQTFPVTLTREQIEPFLTEIALWMLVNKQRSIPRLDALRLVADVLPRLQIQDAPTRWKPDAEGLLRHLVVRSGMLQEPTMELLEFVHPSFQDFLAAKSVFQKAYLPHLIENAHDAMYQDVAVMAVSQVQNDRDRQNELLERLVERAKRDAKQSRQLYLLAAACLADAGMVDPKWVKLVQTKTRALLPPRSSREAQVLAAAGEFTLDLLADVGRTRKPTVAEAVATVEAISLMGGGGDVGMRILRSLAERYGNRIGPELISAWHQTQDPRAFRDEVLAHGDFSDVTVLINSDDLLPLVDGLPGMERLRIAEHVAGPPTAVALVSVAAGRTHIKALPDYPNLRMLDLGHPESSMLQGIERFGDVTTVRLAHATDPDLRPLAALPKLTSLAMTDMPKVDLTALSAVPTLHTLTVESAEPVDLTPLAGLATLTSVTLGASRFTAREPLPQVFRLEVDEFHDDTDRAFPRLNTLVTRSQHRRAGSCVQLSEVTTLALRGLQEVDAAPLTAMPHLDHLNLRGSENATVIDLDALAVSKLSLNRPSHRVLAELPLMSRLRQLDLHRMSGRTLDRLPEIPQLQRLELWKAIEPPLAKLVNGDRIASLVLGMAEDVDLRGLAAFSALTSIEIADTYSIDIEPLTRLPNLRDLFVYRVKHFDRPGLSRLKALKSLLLDTRLIPRPEWLPQDAELTLYGDFSEVSPETLATLPTLRGLNVETLPACGLSAFASVPTIECLGLNGVAGVRVEDFAAWPALAFLNLMTVPDLDFHALQVLPELRRLRLHRMAYVPLDAVPNLEQLELSETRVQLAELTVLPRLRRLVLRSMPDSDLSVLATLPQLRKLELLHMPWADLSPFQARPDIELIVR